MQVQSLKSVFYLLNIFSPFVVCRCKRCRPLHFNKRGSLFRYKLIGGFWMQLHLFLSSAYCCFSQFDLLLQSVQLNLVFAKLSTSGSITRDCASITKKRTHSIVVLVFPLAVDYFFFFFNWLNHPHTRFWRQFRLHFYVLSLESKHLLRQVFLLVCTSFCIALHDAKACV